MVWRISILTISLFCVCLLLPRQAVGEEAQKASQVSFSLHGKKALKKGLLKIVNIKDGKPDEKNHNLVMKIDKEVVEVESRNIEEIHFDQTIGGKKDSVALSNGKELEGEIQSEFKIEVMLVNYRYDRKKLNVIVFTHEKKQKTSLPQIPSPLAKFPYAFWNAPQVFQVRKDGECCKLPDYCSLKKCAEEASPTIKTWPVRIATPANFPQVRYGEAGECIETVGVIVYEGMQLVVANDGRYEVTFNASTPRVPVTMRLTLMVCDPAAKRLVPLTLPAIALVPEYRAEQDGGGYAVSSNNYQENWHVRHLGYSPELRDLFSGSQHVNSIRMSRDGVARFGSLPLSR